MRIMFRLVTRWSSALLQENSSFRRGHSQGYISNKFSSFYARPRPRLASSLYLAKVFFGGGTGITPLMSMLREAAHDPATPVIFYGSHQVHGQSSNCILLNHQPGSPDLPSHQPTCPPPPSGAAPPSRVQRAHLLHRSPEILSSILTLIGAFKFQILYFFHCSDVR